MREGIQGPSEVYEGERGPIRELFCAHSSPLKGSRKDAPSGILLLLIVNTRHYCLKQFTEAGQDYISTVECGIVRLNTIRRPEHEKIMAQNRIKCI